MADVTVSQFAEVLKVPVDRLLVQLDQAGIKVEGPDDRISDDAKLELLTHLRRSHGSGEDADAAPRKITLKRKTQSELKLAGGQGRARTVNVEVRRQRTYIKRDVLEEQARQQQDEIDAKRREAEEAARRESERVWRPKTAAAPKRSWHGRRLRKKPVVPPSNALVKRKSVASGSARSSFSCSKNALPKLRSRLRRQLRRNRLSLRPDRLRLRPDRLRRDRLRRPPPPRLSKPLRARYASVRLLLPVGRRHPRSSRHTTVPHAMGARSCTSLVMSALATRRSAARNPAPWLQVPRAVMPSRCRRRQWFARSASARR